MSHSYIFKIKTLLKEDEKFEYEPISSRDYKENGFIDGFHDYVKDLDYNETNEAYVEMLTIYPFIFQSDGLVDGVETGHISKESLEEWLDIYKEKIEEITYNTFKQDKIDTYDLESYINPQWGYFVEDRFATYRSMPQFLINCYNIMIINKIDTLYYVYEGALDYHC